MYTLWRILASVLLHCAVCVVVLVSGLWLWTRFHIQLRTVTEPLTFFILYVICLGTPLYAAVARFAKRSLGGRLPLLAIHIATASILYIIALYGVIHLVIRESGGFEGADIVGALSIIVAGYGIIVNGIWIGIYGRSCASVRVAT